MKRLSGRAILTLLAAYFVLASATPLIAEVKQISYQGRVTTATGSPVADGNHTFRFDLYGYPTTGTSLWNETASIATGDGLFSHALGSVNPLNDNALTFDSLFLQVTFDGQVQTPRTRLTPTARAHRVYSVHSARGGTVKGSLYMFDTLAYQTYAAIQPYSSTGDAEFSISGTDRYVWLDMGSAGTKSVRLPIGAIDATEMQNEPGLGSYVNETGFTVSSGVQYLAGRTMAAPSDGYLLVIATAEVWLTHTYGSADNFYFGLSDNSTSLPTRTKTAMRVGAGLPSETYTQPITVHALFPIDSGAHAFYFLGERISGSCHVENIMMTELFIPTAYSTVNTPMPPAGEADVQTVAYDPAAEQMEAKSFDQERVNKEMAAMKAELEALKQRLNALSEQAAIEK